MTEINLMGGEKSEFQKMIGRMLVNRDWLNENIGHLIEEYEIGDWLAVSDGKVIAKESSWDGVKAALGDKFGGETLILCVPDKDIPQPI